MSSNVLVTKTRDNTEVTVYLQGKHYRRRDHVKEIFAAANNYRVSGTKEDLDKLLYYLNPKGALVNTLFGGDFYLNEKDGRTYLAGTTVPIPERLVEMMRDHEKNGWPIEPFRNFWALSLLNPDPEARDEFVDYVSRYGIVITDFGYAVLYKAVVVKKRVKNKKASLKDFVAESYTLAKKRKKGLARFTIYKKDGTYRLSEGDSEEGEETMGNLKDLHDNLDQIKDPEGETIYTDKHSGKMEIRIGERVWMERDRCDPNWRVLCSSGLHVGHYQYVKGFGSHGDTILSVLVNPMNVVSVPPSETTKMRVCEYIPRGVMVGGESREWEEIPEGFTEDSYMGPEILALKDHLGKTGSEETRKIVENRLIRLSEKAGNEPIVTRQGVQVYEEEVEPGVFEVRVVKGEVDEENKSYTVSLKSVPSKNQIAVIKVIRQLTGLGLKEAKQMAASKNVIVMENQDRIAAQTAKEALEEAGAKVILSK